MRALRLYTDVSSPFYLSLFCIYSLFCESFFFEILGHSLIDSQIFQCYIHLVAHLRLQVVPLRSCSLFPNSQNSIRDKSWFISESCCFHSWLISTHRASFGQFVLHSDWSSALLASHFYVFFARIVVFERLFTLCDGQVDCRARL